MTINFSLKRSRRIDYVYYLGSHTVKSVNMIKDLGIYFSSDLSFNNHIQRITSQSFEMLWFIKRSMQPFNDVCSIWRRAEHTFCFCRLLLYFFPPPPRRKFPARKFLTLRFRKYFCKYFLTLRLRVEMFFNPNFRLNIS